MSAKHTYQSVWEKLQKIDCNDKKKTKNGLSYLSWAWAWGKLMEHYPEATYEFFNECRDEFGHVEVWCRIRIGELERIMWLPVMDYKNNAIKNPDLRKISDTRMRCLTKCIGMFGLGHYIYAGEDLPDGPDNDEPTEPEPPKPAPKKKAEKKTPPPAKNKSEPKSETAPNTIADADEAANAVTFLIDTVDNFASESLVQLRDFYNTNKALIDLLDTQFPEQYAKLKDHLSALKAKLQEEAA